ncbi:MAG: hypothetical protein L7F78_15115 [Syntrophales bacterium LBB04]|nr:hypothetical protein [Syntrophales bacterium LBB04]
MKKVLRGVIFLFVIAIGGQLLFSGILSAAEPDKIVQAGATLTVAESKRLIGKAVAQMPIVKNALSNGMVIIIKGTTNRYVAEEITGQKIEPAEFATGRLMPKQAELLPKGKSINHVILEKGKVVDIPLPDAAKKLKPGDVVMKGANALDYKNRIAACNIMVGPHLGFVQGPDAGTTGMTMPSIVARKVHLVIPVGLEKLVAGDIVDLTLKMREPMESLNVVPSMWLLTGEIVTELEAIKILTGATAFQANAGGVGGAEGGSWLVFRGTPDQVKKAMELAKSVKGEPPYTE